MEVYIVTSRFKKRTDFTSINVSQECYKTKEQAIEFCKSKLSKEELEEREKHLRRNFIDWYEFESKDYSYEIKILKLI